MADDLASEADADLTAGTMKDAFSDLRRHRSAGPRIISPISLPGGTLVSDRRLRWNDYYSDLLNSQHIPPLQLWSVDVIEDAANTQRDESVSQ